MDNEYKPTGEDIEYRHIRYKTIPQNYFHLHNGYEFYFLVSGDVNYLVEKNIYNVALGDLIITDNQELHRVCHQSDKTYERITLIFNPSVVTPFNSMNCDLLQCFTARMKGENNKISLNKMQISELMYLFNKFEHLNENPSEFNDILKLVYLIEFLVFINNTFKKDTYDNSLVNVPDKLSSIMNYIHEHPDADLTLDFFQSHFFIDKFYLCKMFKKSIGSSIYEYIICVRISMAKKLISDGFNLSEISNSCGFKDYSSFFRMFKKHIGVSPSQYKKEVTYRQVY